MNLGLSYGELVFMRIFQAWALGFVFIPINILAYAGIKQSESNDVSGLTNLARNIGGSAGTAFLATMLTRRTLAHEDAMGRSFTPTSQAFVERARSMANLFAGGNGAKPAGSGPSAGALHAAQASIYNQLHRQAAALAYVDIIEYLAVFCSLMLPLVFLIPRPSKDALSHAGH